MTIPLGHASGVVFYVSWPPVMMHDAHKRDAWLWSVAFATHAAHHLRVAAVLEQAFSTALHQYLSVFPPCCHVCSVASATLF